LPLSIRSSATAQNLLAEPECAGQERVSCSGATSGQFPRRRQFSFSIASHAAEQVVPSTSSLLLQLFDFSCAVSGFLQVIPGLVLELLNQKIEVF
jgi:hypothetical protein